MTTPVSAQSVCKIAYSSTDELIAKLRIIANRHGYDLVPLKGERITVKELCRRVRHNNISERLKSPLCPWFHYRRGKRRIVWLVPNQPLLDYLTNNTKGKRNDL